MGLLRGGLLLMATMTHTPDRDALGMLHNHRETQLAERSAIVEGKLFVVQYNYYPYGAITVPATNPVGQAHYSSIITVIDAEGKHVASFNGQYTEKGCFEDEPKMLVEKALKLRQEQQE